MASNTPRLAGQATPQATQAYQSLFANRVGKGHFSTFANSEFKLSSLGVGTYPGMPDIATDTAVASIITAALTQGINVIDTAAHYRYGHALAAVGAGLRNAVAAGIDRSSMFIVSKGGFLTFRNGPPDDFAIWFEREVVEPGRGNLSQLASQSHMLSPAYIDYQLELTRYLVGVEVVDAFLVDQPEVHIAQMGKERMHQALLAIFEQLERAVADGRIGCYGVSSFYAFRVETDHPLFMSLTSLLGLAEKASLRVHGNSGHHCRMIQLPFNQGQLEGFTRFNQAANAEQVMSTLQAAYQLGLYVMASHSLLKGQLATQVLDVVAQAMPANLSAACCAMQFTRSTPGVGTALVGLSQPGHLEDMLAVASMPVLDRKRYLQMYQRAE